MLYCINVPGRKYQLERTIPNYIISYMRNLANDKYNYTDKDDQICRERLRNINNDSHALNFVLLYKNFAINWTFQEKI